MTPDYLRHVALAARDDLEREINARQTLISKTQSDLEDHQRKCDVATTRYEELQKWLYEHPFEES